MTPKIGLIIVHGFMNATIKNYGYDQWSLTINVHSYIYEHRSCMINDHRYRYEHQSCMINDHRFRHEHWSSMIIDHEHNYSWSMIVAMKCCWSYMISVDQWVISWTLWQGASASACSEICRGPRAFSEPETLAVKNFILNRWSEPFRCLLPP